MWRHNAICQLWGDGRNKLPLVLVEDVARGLLAALDMPEIEGESFNLVGEPCLSAQEYLDALDRAGGFRIQRFPTPAAQFFAADLFKWLVKVMVRFPERRKPTYRDWRSRTQRATFDCSHARTRLFWRPESDRDEIIRRGIVEPLAEILAIEAGAI
jgi:nucleoside-diphosphate-sugar epimerase